MSFSLTRFVSQACALLNTVVQLLVTLGAALNLGWRSEATGCEIRLVGNGEGYIMMPKRERLGERSVNFSSDLLFSTHPLVK